MTNPVEPEHRTEAGGLTLPPPDWYPAYRSPYVTEDRVREIIREELAKTLATADRKSPPAPVT